MAEQYYYPNSAGAFAWKGRGSDPPTGLDDFKTTAYTGGEETTVSTDDSNYVLSVPGVPFTEKCGHHILIDTAEAGVTQLDFLAKGYSLPPTNLKLYVWNTDTTDWVLKDTAFSGPPEEVLTVECTILEADIPDYMDVDGIVEYAIVSGAYDFGDTGCLLFHTWLKTTYEEAPPEEEGTWTVDAWEDDACRDYGDHDFWLNADQAILLGAWLEDPPWVFYYDGWFRFPNVTVPQGATIVSAYLEVWPTHSSSEEIELRIRGQDEDDALQIPSGELYDNRNWTTAFADWSLGAGTPWTPFQYYATPSLVSIVQEIVDRPGFQAGNAMAFQMANNSSSHARAINQVKYPTGGNGARLTITYTATSWDEHGGTTVVVRTGAVDSVAFDDHVGTDVEVRTGAEDVQNYLTENVGTGLSIVTGAEDMKYTHENVGTTVLVVTGAEDEVLEYQGTVVSMQTGIAFEEWGRFEHVGTIVAVRTGAFDVKTYPAEDVGTVVSVVTGMTDEWIRAEHRGTIVHVQTGAEDELLYVEHVGTTVSVVTGCFDQQAWEETVGTIVKVITGITELDTMPLFLSLPPTGARRVRWVSSLPSGHSFVVLIDGKVTKRTPDRDVLLSPATKIRQYLIVAAMPTGKSIADIEAAADTPMDRVKLTWTSCDVTTYRVLRQDEGETTYTTLGEVQGLQYVDGPMDDNVGTYKVMSVDEEGDSSLSTAKTMVVYAPPKPPTNLAWDFDTDTKVLTLNWAASESEDVTVYPIYGSNGETELQLASAPIATPAGVSWQKAFTIETGLFIFLIRARDSTGRESGSLEPAMVIRLEGGTWVGRLTEPKFVRADPAPGGTVEVQWSYFPIEESGPGTPGLAHEGRIYWDNGAGIIDYTTPVATVNMGNPVVSASYSWTSTKLTDGVTYAFVVRAATMAWPNGVETQNTDEHRATVDSDIPDAPLLKAQLI